MIFASKIICFLNKSLDLVH